MVGLTSFNLMKQVFYDEGGWSLIANKDSLQARVIRSKYKCDSDLIPHIETKRQGSQVWSGIKKTWDRMLPLGTLL